MVRTSPVRFTVDHRGPAHAHAWDQLTFAAEGAMTVHTDGASWIVPPHRAVWVPAGTVHTEDHHGEVAVRHVYLAPGLVTVGATCRALNVAPLLREVIVQACRHGALDRRVPVQRNLTAVLLDLIAAAPVEPLHLPMPRDPRAARLAARMLADPSDDATIAALRGAGASRRTLERCFLAETTLSLGAWRRRMRILHSLRTLAAGASVTDAALAAGYTSTSAFIAVFRRELGTTPGRYRVSP
ncbi:MAG: helix-turn-helix transcriptional regulator [Deltaproteobacteria bacterium]|nr:helix-turn-helix transcriptional regulator [Deltaproteobacteria bacterium]